MYNKGKIMNILRFIKLFKFINECAKHLHLQKTILDIEVFLKKRNIVLSANISVYEWHPWLITNI